MLRVEMHNSPHAMVMRLEGRFAGEYAEHSRTLVMRCNNEMKLLVDLTEVTFVDSVGEEVLSFFARMRAEFIAESSYCLDVCERLRLPVARSPRRNGKHQPPSSQRNH